MTRSIYELTAPAVRQAVAGNPTAVIPLGSVEQHGPHLPCGTDTIAAELVASGLADRLEALYVPFGPYGVTPIHAGHPGTISLSRRTFEALLTEVCEELVAMGVERLVFVNWHEGNIASLDGVATELQDRHRVVCAAVQACYVAQRIYRDRGGELTHGGGIETLAVTAHDPSLVRLEQAGPASRPEGVEATDAMRRSREVYGYVTDVTEIAHDGWYGNPGWATEELAGSFVDEMVEAILERLPAVLEARGTP